MQPPRLARTLLRLLVPSPGREFIAGDIEEDFEAMIRRGVEPGRARRWYWKQVLLSIGSWWAHRATRRGTVEHFEGIHTEEGKGMGIETMIRDVRFALRGMMKEPAFASLVVLTLALGIGASTAIFSVVNAVMLQSLPYPQAERLVRVAETVGRDAQNAVPNAIAYYHDWRQRTDSFELLAAYQPFASVVLTEDDQAATRLGATYATSSYFELLGAEAQVGRLLGESEDAAPPLEAPFAVISHGLWQRRFGEDPDVVGTTLRLDGTVYEVVGVMEPDFFDVSGGAQTDVWLPVAMAYPSVEEASRRTARIFQVVGRLRPGRSLEQARQDVHSVAAAVAEEYPDVHGSTWAAVIPMRQQILGGLSTPLLALLGGAGFLLMVACVNVASLVLVRGARRSREVALRQALGASRGRLVRQLLTESVVLSIMGGALGVFLTFLSVDRLMELSAINLPPYLDVGVDGTVLAVAVGVALATGVAFGLWPAVQSSRTDLRGELTQGDSRAGGGAGSAVLRNGLVVLEVAVAVVLVVGSGLMIRSFQELRGTEMGFRTEGVLTMVMNLSNSDYPTVQDTREFRRRAQERLEAIPGVTSVGVWGPNMPGQSGVFSTVVAEGRTVETQLDADLARMHHVSPGAMEEMGIRLMAGRTIEPGDGPDSRPVAVVSQSLAEEVWPGENPVGKRFHHFIPPGRDPADFDTYEVVGVVSDALHGGRGVSTTTFPTAHDMYFSYWQREAGMRSVVLLLGTRGDPNAVADPVRAALEELAPDAPVLGLQSMEDRLDGQLVVPRFTALLMALFGSLSLFLAAMGIYGLLANSVASRSREIGLRKALGSPAKATMGLFVGHGMKLAGLGVVVGLGASLALARFVNSLLVGVQPNDPLTLGGTAAILLAVALLAAYVPTRRALKVDPAVALRAE